MSKKTNWKHMNTLANILENWDTIKVYIRSGADVDGDSLDEIKANIQRAFEEADKACDRDMEHFVEEVFASIGACTVGGLLGYFLAKLYFIIRK